MIITLYGSSATLECNSLQYKYANILSIFRVCMLAELCLCQAPSISQLILRDLLVYEVLSTCTQLLENK